MRTNWSKVNDEKYKELTDRRLQALQESISPNTSTEIIISRINSILTESSRECQPKPKSSKQRPHKWYLQFKPLISEVKAAHYAWKNSGKPAKDSTEATTLKIKKAQP